MVKAFDPELYDELREEIVLMAKDLKQYAQTSENRKDKSDFDKGVLFDCYLVLKQLDDILKDFPERKKQSGGRKNKKEGA